MKLYSEEMLDTFFRAPYTGQNIFRINFSISVTLVSISYATRRYTPIVPVCLTEPNQRNKPVSILSEVTIASNTAPSIPQLTSLTIW